jgi:hypothetical protein
MCVGGVPKGHGVWVEGLRNGPWQVGVGTRDEDPRCRCLLLDAEECCEEEKSSFSWVDFPSGLRCSHWLLGFQMSNLMVGVISRL